MVIYFEFLIYIFNFCAIFIIQFGGKLLKYISLQVYCILIILTFKTFSLSQDSLIVYNLDENIIVTASRIPTHFPSVARSVIVIDQNQIKMSGAQTVIKLLESTAGIDLQQRGEQGVQTDLNIRGASFEQSLVLIDGVKMSDPQTGHHLMDIPLTVNDIQRIEILKGQGSRLYGPNAFGGVINIITKQALHTEIDILNMLGENKFYRRNFSILIPMFKGGHRISLSQKGSDGYRDNTDFEIKTASYGFNYKFGRQQLSIFGGLLDKKFGANSFYTPAFPNQWERTQTATIKTNAKGKISSINYTSNLYHRYHTDEFMLNRDNPSFYHNRHYTNISGFDIHLSKVNPIGNTSLGSEIIRESIESNNLGSHQRYKTGFFLEHQVIVKKLQVTIGTTLYHFTDWGWQAWPGLDLGYQFTDHIDLYGSVGYAFRAPTFTELYYSDPANRSNKNLKAEKGRNYELGWRFTNSSFFTNVTIFRREGKNLIDWIWQTPDSVWQVMNITKVNTDGVEFNVNYRERLATGFITLNSVRMSYTYLYSQKDIFGQISKYLLNHLRHQAVFGLNIALFNPSLQLNIEFRYENRMYFGNRYIMDTNLSWPLGANFKLHFDITNLLNNAYEDFHAVPLPGRWIKAGVSFNLIKNNGS